MVLRATEVVAFAADQGEAASGERPGAVGLEDVEEATTGGRLEAGLIPRQPGGLEEGRGEIGEADKLADLTTGAGDAGWPAHREGQMVGIIVGRALHAREGHPVVGRHDDERSVEFASGFQLREDLAQLGVEVFDLHRVIKHVTADRRIVGPVFRHAVHVVGLFAEAGVAAFFVRAVGFLEAEPEEPGLIGRGLLQEVGEVGGVVVVRDGFGRRRGLAASEDFARHRPRRVVSLER